MGCINPGFSCPVIRIARKSNHKPPQERCGTRQPHPRSNNHHHHQRKPIHSTGNNHQKTSVQEKVVQSLVRCCQPHPSSSIKHKHEQTAWNLPGGDWRVDPSYAGAPWSGRVSSIHTRGGFCEDSVEIDSIVRSTRRYHDTVNTDNHCSPYHCNTD